MSSIVRAILDLNNYHRHFLTGEEFDIDITGLDHFLFCGDLCTDKNYDELKNAGIRNIYLGAFSRYNENRPSPTYLYLVINKQSDLVYRVKKASLPIPNDLQLYLNRFHPEYKDKYLMLNNNANSDSIFNVKLFVNESSNRLMLPRLRMQRFKELLAERRIPLYGTLSRPEHNQYLLREDQTNFILLDIDIETKSASIQWLNKDFTPNFNSLEIVISYMHSEYDVTALNYALLQSSCVLSIPVTEAPLEDSNGVCFDFPAAMRAVLDGRAVSRRAWDNMKFISYTEAQEIPADALWSKYNRAAYEPTTQVIVKGGVTINHRREISPYVITNEDFLANDWYYCSWVESKYQMKSRPSIPRPEILHDAIEQDSNES